MMRKEGYTLIMLMIAVSLLSIGLLVAVPLWQTELQREKEEELIFRGKQYAEAIRIFQMKKPGTFPRTLDELLKEKCIRKLYKDPMTSRGEWNLILPYTLPQTPRASTKRTESAQKVLIVPYNLLKSVGTSQIIGVVSSSKKKSIKIYLEQESYDKWLFFYGQDAKKMPEIVYFGESEKD